ncbi:MAG: FAD-binding oxidoreductase [Pararhodobacter sp.]|nr:FAD-binding oxidoreductase [Pararhodobacter sp.]
MARLYEPDAYDTARWPESYWRASTELPLPTVPLEGDAEAEVAIIGAGYAGLNAALELAERFGIRATVLEAGQPGWGASGRNGGFCCHGGARLTSGQIASRHGDAGAQEWADFEYEAIERVRDNLTRYTIDADAGPEGELYMAHSARSFARMQAAPLEPGCELLDRAALAERGMQGAGLYGAILSPHGFPLHPLKYALGLARAAQAAGVTVHGDSAVTGLAREGAAWRLQTARGSLRAKRVLVATNGYSDEALPHWLHGRIFPLLSAILVTRPLSEGERAAQGWTSQIMAYDSRRVLHYYRLLPDGRFLFGGRGGISARLDALAAFHTTLRGEFDAMFPAFAAAGTEHYWAGLVCMTGSWHPFCAEVPEQPGLFAALGWHGNGVAAASEGGRRIAHALAGGANPAPALVQAPLNRFPLPALRRPLKGVAVGLAKLADRLA